MTNQNQNHGQKNGNSNKESKAPKAKKEPKAERQRCTLCGHTLPDPAKAAERKAAEALRLTKRADKAAERAKKQLAKIEEANLKAQERMDKISQRKVEIQAKVEQARLAAQAAA
jgi:hypothetical protein